MTRGESNSTPLSALGYVETRFPDQAETVRQLFQEDESFRSMCEDLAAAIDTLDHVERLPDHVRETRRLEYASLVDALVSEIDEALSRSKVVVLKHSGAGRPKPH